MQRLLGYLGGENEDGCKLRPTVPFNSVFLTADSRAETVKGAFFFAIVLPREAQVRMLCTARMRVLLLPQLAHAVCPLHTNAGQAAAPQQPRRARRAHRAPGRVGL